MGLYSRDDLNEAAQVVHQVVGPTPTYHWPLLARRAGCDVWVKHENHTPIGAFKIRGGIVYIENLKRSQPNTTGVISATRGNHGQSIAMAATRAGMRSVIFVPEGNSVEKNAAMQALGAELVVHGRDFDEAKDACAGAASEEGLHMVPSFHPLLVKGVATYALEFLEAAPRLDVVYVPIGMGSGICGMITARDALGLTTDIVGVVAEGAPSIALSFDSGFAVPTNEARTFADGMACRDPHPEALDVILKGAARIVQVSDDEIAEAMRIYYQDTHNLSEGAGAAPLAALMRERSTLAGKSAGVVLSGGNVDRPVYATVLAGETPAA